MIHLLLAAVVNCQTGQPFAQTNPDSVSVERTEIVSRSRRESRSVVVKRRTGERSPGIVFEPCEYHLADRTTIDAEIGRMKVPELRGPRGSARNGTSITLGMIRLRSSKRRSAPPIVYLDGTPRGLSASDLMTFPRLAQFFDSLTSAGDVILMDYRGAGLSTPNVSCKATATLDGDTFLDRAHAARYFLQNARQCVESLRSRSIDPSAYTWDAVAHDVEDVKRALGAARINIVGFSSGTHAALAVLRKYPRSINRVALVGTEGPDNTRKLPLSGDSAIQRITTDPSLHEGFASLAKRVIGKLGGAPLQVTVTVTDSLGRREITGRFGAFGLQYLTAKSISGPRESATLQPLYTSIDRGDTRLLRRVLERIIASGDFNVLEFLLDGSSGISAKRAAQIESEASTAILGDAQSFPYPEILAALKITPLPDWFRKPVVSSVPALFVTGELDGNTPVFQAEQVRRGFARSDHIIVPGAGHADPMSSPTVARQIAQFLSDGG